jgi:predicted Holliday junction resolvase-like endonuclease
MGALAALLVVVVWLYVRKAMAFHRLQLGFRQRVAAAQESWAREQATRIREDATKAATREATVQLQAWRAASEGTIRQDAINRSRSVIAGKVTEHLVPYLPDFPWNPKDARFIGSPVDMLVFDGMDDGDIRGIILVEIKTGFSALTIRERQIREAIEDGRVEWKEIRVAGPARSPSLPRG